MGPHRKSKKSLSLLGVHAAFVLNISHGALHNFRKSTHWKPNEKLPTPVLYKDTFSYQCFTDFEPRTSTEMSVSSIRYIAPPKAGTVSTNVTHSKWQLMPDVALLGGIKDIILRAKKAGYLDFKYSHIGNNASGPLSVVVHVMNPDASIVICETPPIW